jgi:hypothetical protein
MQIVFVAKSFESKGKNMGKYVCGIQKYTRNFYIFTRHMDIWMQKKGFHVYCFTQ